MHLELFLCQFLISKILWDCIKKEEMTSEIFRQLKIWRC